MNGDRAKALGIIEAFLKRTGKKADDLHDSMGLYGDGLELDSLETAELSATLEDEFGRDPFSANDEMPETVGGVLAFYETAIGP